MALVKVISGGQTGADRAGLDAAVEAGIPTGGWAPKYWQTTDGYDPELARYGLVESKWGYRGRTLENVKDSEGTLILARNMSSPGTALTISMCTERRKPWKGIHLGHPHLSALDTARWIKENTIAVLNVAGNSAKSAPGIYEEAVDFLRKVFGNL